MIRTRSADRIRAQKKPVLTGFWAHLLRRHPVCHKTLGKSETLVSRRVAPSAKKPADLCLGFGKVVPRDGNVSWLLAERGWLRLVLVEEAGGQVADAFEPFRDGAVH